MRGKCSFISRISQVPSNSEQLTEAVQGNYVLDAILYLELSVMKYKTFFAPCCTDTLQVVPISEIMSKEDTADSHCQEADQVV